MPQRWRGTIAMEGVEVPDTNGMRVIDPGAISWRDLPLCLALVTEDFGGHDGAAPVGTIDTIEVRDGGHVYGEGVFSADPAGEQAALWVGEGVLRGVSVDPGDHPNHREYVEEIIDPATGETVDMARVYEVWDEIDAALEAGDEAKAQELLDWLDTLYVRTRFTAYEIGSATIVRVAAFADATIELVPAEVVVASATENLTLLRSRLYPVRAALALRQPVRQAAGPATMRAVCYRPQKLARATQWTIDDDGRMLGHLWRKDACHRSFTGQCLLPPQDREFRDFHVGAGVRLDDGTRMKPGVLTFMDLHAGEAQGLSREQLNRLMEDTGTQLGPVRLYADEFGVQCCGQVYDDVSPTLVARALAGFPSYDERRVNGKWSLFGLHIVNTPGQAWYEEEDGEVVRKVASIGPVIEADVSALATSDCGCGEPASCTCDTSTPSLSPLAAAALAHLDATHVEPEPVPPSAAERLAALTG